MKWALMGLAALVVLGAAGYGIYRWTDVPEQAQAWMDEQDLKNFPTQARREVKEMREELEAKRQTRRELQNDIIAREGREDWDADALGPDGRNWATVVWYDREIERYESGIEDIVRQVKEQRTRMVDNGTVDSDTGRIPADHAYTIIAASGNEIKMTEAQARRDTDLTALKIRQFKRKRDLQQRMIDKKKEYVEKLDDLIGQMETKIEDLEVFIEEMEVELELLELEEDIAEVNAAISGEDNGNRLGRSIALYKEKKRELLADQTRIEETESEAEDQPSYFDEPEESDDESGASASYWS